MGVWSGNCRRGDLHAHGFVRRAPVAAPAGNWLAAACRMGRAHALAAATVGAGIVSGILRVVRSGGRGLLPVSFRHARSGEANVTRPGLEPDRALPFIHRRL